MRSRLLLLGVLSAPAALLAQSSRDTVRLPVEVITATRDPIHRYAATATATVLDGARLRAEGVRFLADALRRVPGLAVARTSSFGSTTSLFLRGGQSNYVRVLVDGVPLNEPGGVVDLGRIPLEDVERIEVVRGPASVLYGSEAVTGVVQVFTRRGADRSASRFEVGGGSFGARNASAGIAGRLRGVGASLSAEHSATDGILPFNNGYQNDAAVVSMDIGAGGMTEARATARYGASVYHYPTNASGAIEDRNAERTEHRVSAGFDLTHRWSERLDTRLLVSSSDLWPRTADGPDDAGDNMGFYGYFARATVVRRGVELRQAFRHAGGSVVLGGEWTRETERSSDLSRSEFGDFPGSFRAARETRALVAQAAGERGRASYSVGARLDQNSAFGTFRTARVGASLRLTRTTRIRASTGTAFKAPSFFENFATGFTTGNADLAPERTRGSDLGIETVVGNVALVRVTGFANRFRDLIQYTGAPPAPGDPNYYNVAAANAGGVEVELELPSLAGFGVDVGYTWTDSRVADAGFDSGAGANFVVGQRLLRRPDHLFTLGVVRGLGTIGSIAARVNATGEREDRDFSTFPATPITMPAYGSLDLTADLAPALLATRGLRLRLAVMNATDARIRNVTGFQSPGRHFSAGLKLER